MISIVKKAVLASVFFLTVNVGLFGQVKYSIGPVIKMGISGILDRETTLGSNKRWNVEKPGAAWAFGLGQRLKFNERWSMELDVLWARHSLEEYREYKYLDNLTGDEFYSRDGDKLKLNAIAVPVKLRRSFSMGGKLYSIYFGGQYGRQKQSTLVSHLIYRNVSKNEDIYFYHNKYELIEGENLSGNNTFMIEKNVRIRILGGVGMSLTKRLHMDVDVQVPIGQNKIRYWESLFDFGAMNTIEYNDMTMMLQFSYWIL